MQGVRGGELIRRTLAQSCNWSAPLPRAMLPPKPKEVKLKITLMHYSASLRS
jgi:hypothetical protein